MEFRRATSEEQILGWLAELGDSARIIAGGTDVMMQYARGELSPAVFVHIEGARELAGVASAPVSRFGALVTHRHLATDPLLRDRHPALADAAATVGGWQTQAVGTLGGNICNASPAADTAAPLLTADAVVELRSAHSARRVPLQLFFLGRRSIDRRPDELVTAIQAEPISENAVEAYVKVGRRGAMVVAVAGLAARLQFNDDGRVTHARLALCSMAQTPVRAHFAERILSAGGASAEAVRDAADAMLEEASPIDDARATAAYRRMVLVGLLDRAIATCRSRAKIERGF
jgi:carbon-monoxide dehydrogenase medium subunit